MNTIKNLLSESMQQMGMIESLSVGTVILSFTVAFLCAALIYVVYRYFYKGVSYSPSFGMLLIMLTLLTNFIILCISTNLVLSLGMVGALSIVRFRAAIKEPIEIVYLFWSIASGIVIGAGMIPLAVIGSAIIGVILILFANRKTHENPYILILNCKDEQAEDTAVKIARTALKRFLVKSKTVSGGGVELTAEVRLMDAATSFVNKLYDIEGVHNVTLVSYNGEYMS